MPTRLSLAAISLGVLLAAACAAPRFEPVPRPVVVDGVSLSIADRGAAPYVGGTLQLSAVLRGGGIDSALAPDAVSWASYDHDVAWVSADGGLHLLKPGRVRVSAQAGERTGVRSFTVGANPVASVVTATDHVGPCRVGDSVAIAAAALDADGRRVLDAPIEYGIVLAPGEAPHARISPAGIFTADAPGLYVALARSNGAASLVAVTVTDTTPAPAAEPLAAAGETSSSAPRLDAVRVRARPVHAIHIHAPREVAFEGTWGRFRADVAEEDAPAVHDAPVRWSVSDTTIALVDATTGRIFYRGHGWVTVRASYAGRSATRRLYVGWNPSARLVLRAPVSFARAGDRVPLVNDVWVRGGTRLTHARVNIAVLGGDGAPAAARLTSDRHVVLSEPGTYRVIAEMGGLADEATVVVYPAGGHCELHLVRWDPSCR